MNRKYLFLFFYIALCHSLTAQKSSFGLDTGYGTYQMTDIRHILGSSMNSNVLQPHSVSNFPGYLFFRPYLGINYQHVNVGIAYTLMSTGARYSIHDYSGGYTFDAQIIGNAGGIFVELPVYSIQRFSFLIAAEAGFIFNKLRMDESIVIMEDYNEQNNYNFKSVNIFIKPCIRVDYNIWENLSANFSLGYHKDIIANKMYMERDISRVSDIIADWDGFRTSIGVSCSF